LSPLFSGRSLERTAYQGLKALHSSEIPETADERSSKPGVLAAVFQDPPNGPPPQEL
jgi:hypothetical protein